MRRKPTHLSRRYADQFKEPEVVQAYRHRPPYVAEAIDWVMARLHSAPGRILDIGCGSGDWTFALASRGSQIDAIDASEAMLARARVRAGTRVPNVRWRLGPMESIALEPPYDLVTAAESLHWMDWHVVLPRIAEVLASGGELIIVERVETSQPWSEKLVQLIETLSTNQDYAPYSLVNELTCRGLFRETERVVTQSVDFEQSISDYVESFHSRNGFSRARMTGEAAVSFDAQLTALVLAHVGQGPVVRANACRLIVGTPMPDRPR